MKIEDLPSPGPLSNGIHFAKEVVKAINYAQIQSDLTKGESEAGANLVKFFTECAALCKGLTKTKEKSK